MSFFSPDLHLPCFYSAVKSGKKENLIFDFPENFASRRLREEEKIHSVIICLLSSQVAAKNQDR